jgi:hypothetical protein
MMINVLIRMHKGRDILFKRCITSVFNQTFKDYRIIVSFDDPDCFQLIEKYSVDYCRVFKQVELGETYYNLYCNDLKNMVTDGWFFYLDSDDYLSSDDSLERISKHLDENKYKAVICQMSRSFGLKKPSNEQIELHQVISGKIGMPCIFVHHSIKNIVNFNEKSNADFLYIQKVSSLFNKKVSFVKEVVVHSPKRLFGK